MSEVRWSAAHRWAIALICTAQFVLLVDFSVVNVALATIEPALHFAPAQLQWVVTGYTLTFGALLIFGGRLGDLVGHRRLLLISLGLFALSSLAAGLSQTATMLVVARMLQGAAAAFVAPTALALLTTLFPDGASRARAFGFYQGAGAAGGTAGIVFGGILTQYAGWRSIFLINPPVIALLIVLMIRYLPAPVTKKPARLDIAGAILITLSLASLIFAMSDSQQDGFSSWETIGGFATCAASLLAFIAVEQRVDAPLVPLGLLADRTRRTALIATTATCAMLGSYLYFLVLYLQHVLGYSAVRTGLALVPSTGTVLISATLFSRRFIAWIGIKATLSVGIAMMAVGQFVLAMMNARSTYLFPIVPGLVLTAFGCGLAMLAASLAATAGVEPGMRGVVGGLFVTTQQVGPSVGLAVFATIAAARSRAAGGSLVVGFHLSYLLAGVTGLAAALLVLLHLHRIPPSAPPRIVADAELDESELAGLTEIVADQR